MKLTAKYFTRFDDLPSAYRQLFAERAELTFDQSLPWLRRLAELFESRKGNIAIIGLETAGNPAAVLPLVSVQSPFMGANADLQAVTNFYTAHFAPVTTAGLPRSAVGEALAAAIIDSPEPWRVLDLNPFDPESEVFTGLAAGLRRRRAVVEPYFRFGNWYEQLDGRTYEQYYAARPTQLRETVRRKRRKLEKENDCEFTIVTAPDEVAAAMDAYESIYEKSWKRPEPYQEFIRMIARDFAMNGWLRLGLLHVARKPAAAQIWFQFGGTASIFKLAYDPAYSRYSVGSLLTSHLLERAISIDHARVVDYLCGDDSYKKDWMSRRRERWGLRAFRLTSIKGLAGAAHSIASRVVRRLRGPSSG